MQNVGSNELNALAGSILTQISVMPFELRLNFLPGLAVDVECKMTVQSPKSIQAWSPGESFAALQVFDFLGEPVTGVSFTDDSAEILFGQTGSILLNKRNSAEDYSLIQTCPMCEGPNAH